MDKKRIRIQAEEMLSVGYSRQQVFDCLVLENPEAKPKWVAELVRYMPTQVGRERYRNLHWILLAIIGFNGALRIFQSMLEPDFEWAHMYYIKALPAIATILFGYSIYRWQGQVFQWVAWVNLWAAFGLLNAIIAFAKGNGDPWVVGFGALSVGIGALAWYLLKHVFPKYNKEKDPLGVMPDRYVFPYDGMG